MLRKLAGQTAIYGVSSILARLLNYLLAPYLTRILSPDGFGIIGDVYAIIPFFLVMLTMGLETGYFRFAGKTTDKGEQDKIFATTWGGVLVGVGLFLALFFAFKNPIDVITRYTNQGYITTMVALLIAIDVAAAIPFTRLRQQQKAKYFVLVRVVSIVVNVLLCLFFFSVLPILSTKFALFAYIYNPAFGVGYVLVANLLGSLVMFSMLYPSFKGIAPRIDKALFRKIFIYSLPLLLSGIAGTANEFIDRQLIKYLMPENVAMATLGIYAAVVRISVIMILFTQMYRFAAEPFFLSGFSKEEFKESNAAAMKYYVIASVAIALFITLFLDIFALLVGPAFREGVYIVPVLLISNMLAGILFNLSFWYKYTEQTKFALYITIAGLMVTVGLNIMLIPRYGYFGSAIARLCCEVAMVAISYYLNQKYFPVPYNLKVIFKYILIGAVLYSVAYLTNLDNNIAKYSLNLLLFTTFIAYALKSEKIDIKRLIKR